MVFYIHLAVLQDILELAVAAEAEVLDCLFIAVEHLREVLGHYRYDIVEAVYPLILRLISSNLLLW